MFKGWFGQHIPTVVLRTVEEAEGVGASIVAARRAITGIPSGPLTLESERKFRKRTQKWLGAQLLQARRHDPVQRLRSRPSCWQLGSPRENGRDVCTGTCFAFWSWCHPESGQLF